MNQNFKKSESFNLRNSSKE